MKTSATVKPPPHSFYGDNYERGLDPWHVNAAPPEVADSSVWDRSEQKSGWYLLDAWGNQIGFVPDGTEFPDA